MEGKIKFGFSKTIKKPNLVSDATAKLSKVELIEAIEGTSIKVTGKNGEDEAKQKLVIPMTNDQKNTPLSKLMEDRLKRAQSRRIKTENGNGIKEEVEIKQEPMDESLDQQAARELIEGLNKQDEQPEIRVFEVPMNPNDLPLDGSRQSTLDDYDRVPIGDFGKAMLRGMGWKEEEAKAESKKAELEGPVLRPKGMGLGADKVIKKQPLLIAPNQSETLEIKKRACVKILAGKHKNFYGTIEGFDDGVGRVVVKLAIGGLKIALNEGMMQPVAKQEFAKYGKILNSEKFEEFKSGEPSRNATLPSTVKREVEERKPARSRSRERRDRSGSKDRKHSIKSTDRRSDRYDNTSSSRKYHGRSRSRDRRARHRSSSSEDRSYKKKSSKHKSHRQASSPDSLHSSENEKKHKKKTKKSKHKRDRS